MNALSVYMNSRLQEALYLALVIMANEQKNYSWLKKRGEIMVSAILHAAMGMIVLFAFLVFLAFSAVALVPILGAVYLLIADLCMWIKSKFD